MNVIKQTKRAEQAEKAMRAYASGLCGQITQETASIGLSWLVFWRSIGEGAEARVREIWAAKAEGRQIPALEPVAGKDGRENHGGKDFRHLICGSNLTAFRSGKKMATMEQIALLAKHCNITLSSIQASPRLPKPRKRKGAQG